MSRKSLLVSAMGVLMGFVSEFVTAFKKRGGTDEELHQLLVGNKSEDFIRQISDLAMEMVKKIAAGPFPIFKTITLGLHQSVKAYRQALANAGFRIGDLANGMLDKVQISCTQVQLDLVAVSTTDLGFKQAVICGEIYAKAREFGLELCPTEVGPALRLTYPDQPDGEWLRLAMEPITDLDGDPAVFEVDRDRDERWLYSRYRFPLDRLWDPNFRWVFVRPRK